MTSDLLLSTVTAFFDAALLQFVRTTELRLILTKPAFTTVSLFACLTHIAPFSLLAYKQNMQMLMTVLFHCLPGCAGVSEHVVDVIFALALS